MDTNALCTYTGLITSFAWASIVALQPLLARYSPAQDRWRTNLHLESPAFGASPNLPELVNLLALLWFKLSPDFSDLAAYRSWE